MVKIFVDPGHGGKDSGAVANGLQEKEVVLSIAKRMEKLLQKYEGVQVKLSRSDDRFLELTERTKIANAWGANYFVSLHINSGGGAGYEDYIYNGSVSNVTVANQKAMNEEIAGATDLNNRGKKRASLAVLRTSKMPSILTENGFIDNGHDAQLLRQSSFLDKVAEGHVNGLVKIFDLKKKVSERPSANLGPFEDVTSDYWAVEAIKYVKENGLMTGHSNGNFGPNDTLTRAQLAQVLYNLSKK